MFVRADEGIELPLKLSDVAAPTAMGAGPRRPNQPVAWRGYRALADVLA